MHRRTRRFQSSGRPAELLERIRTRRFSATRFLNRARGGSPLRLPCPITGRDEIGGRGRTRTSAILALVVLQSVAIMPAGGATTLDGAALTGVEDSVVATIGSVAVTRSDLDAWTRYLELEGRNRQLREDEPGLVRGLALVAALDAECRERGLDLESPGAERINRRLTELATDLLRADVRARTVPSEAAVAQAHRADPSRFHRPKRWVISSILLRWNDGETVDETVARATAIRSRGRTGEDFSRLARRHSDSQSSIRGGRAGAVTLDQLDPEVARVVASLAPDDISEPLEVADGVVIVRCDSIIPAHLPSREESLESWRRQLHREGFDTAWKRLAEAPALSAEELEAAGPPWADVWRAVAGTVEAAGARDDQGPATGAPGDSAVVAEAVRRGLLDGDDATLRARFRAAEARARIALDRRVDAALTPTSEAELRALFSRTADRWIRPEEVLLRGVSYDLDDERERDEVRALHDLAEKLHAGETTLEAIHRQLGTAVTWHDWGWLSPGEVFSLGKAIESAVRSPGAEGGSTLLQEGRTLYVVEVVDRRAPSRLGFDEVRTELGRLSARLQRQAAESEIRDRVLQEVRLVSDGRAAGAAEHPHSSPFR